MPKAVEIFVRSVDTTNTFVGKFSMYLVFVMIGILLYEPIARNLFGISSIWAVEMAQFTMAAYYLLGGGYSMILKGHVRMDLLYGRWSEKKKGKVDAITSLFLIFYLVFLLVGAYSSIEYAVMYGQKKSICVGTLHGAHKDYYGNRCSADAAAVGCDVFQGHSKGKRGENLT